MDSYSMLERVKLRAVKRVRRSAHGFRKKLLFGVAAMVLVISGIEVLFNVVMGTEVVSMTIGNVVGASCAITTVRQNSRKIAQAIGVDPANMLNCLGKIGWFSGQ